MVRMQDEQDVDGAGIHCIRLIPRLRHPRHHGEIVLRIRQRVVRVDVRHSLDVPVRERRDGGHLGDQSHEGDVAFTLVEDVLRRRIKRGQRRHTSAEHRHGVGVVAKPFHELLDVLVHVRVEGDVVYPLFIFRLRGKFSVPEEPRDLEKARLLSELLDGIAAISQNSAVAVDERDRGAARRGVEKGRIVAHHAEVVVLHLDLFEIRRSDRFIRDRNRIRGAGA